MHIKILSIILTFCQYYTFCWKKLKKQGSPDTFYQNVFENFYMRNRPAQQLRTKKTFSEICSLPLTFYLFSYCTFYILYLQYRKDSSIDANLLTCSEIQWDNRRTTEKSFAVALNMCVRLLKHFLRKKTYFKLNKLDVKYILLNRSRILGHFHYDWQETCLGLYVHHFCLALRFTSKTLKGTFGVPHYMGKSFWLTGAVITKTLLR